MVCILVIGITRGRVKSQLQFDVGIITNHCRVKRGVFTRRGANFERERREETGLEINYRYKVTFIELWVFLGECYLN